jgi:type IV pilus assembly protein PilB
MPTRPPLGHLLLSDGSVTRTGLDEALNAQETSSRRLGEILVSRGLVDEEAVAVALARQLELPYLAPPLAPEPDASTLVRADLARSRMVLPIGASLRSLRLAMADPLDQGAVRDVEFQTGRRVEIVVASRRAVERAITGRFGAELSHLIRQLPSESDGDPRQARALERAARAAPVVRLVDHVLRRAIDEGASDIHVEEDAGELRVRQRVDGLLRVLAELPPASHGAVISRIKIMAGMDIAEKRLPQDGGFLLEHAGARLTFRVSTLPVERGEKVVLRILDPARVPAGLGPLGLAPRDLERVRFSVPDRASCSWPARQEAGKARPWWGRWPSWTGRAETSSRSRTPLNTGCHG